MSPFPLLESLLNRLFQQHYDPSTLLPINNSSKIKQALESRYHTKSEYLQLLILYQSVLNASLHPSCPESLQNDISDVLLHSSLSTAQPSQLLDLFNNTVSQSSTSFFTFFFQHDLSTQLSKLSNLFSSKSSQTVEDSVSTLLSSISHMTSHINSIQLHWLDQLQTLQDLIITASSTLSSLQSILNSTGVDRIKAKLHYFHCKSKLLIARIKLLRYQYLEDTYDETSLKAIKVIKTELDSLTEAAKHELQVLMGQLAQYSNCSKSYHVLVSEYGRLEAQKEELASMLQQIS
ncbi:hypothetical protein GEMRC1_008414 [Eukaryota sp. GEM-RC1]